MQNNLIFFILLLFLLTSSYIFTAIDAQKNVFSNGVIIFTPEGEQMYFMVNSTEQLKDIMMTVANNTDLNFSVPAGQLHPAVNNTINSVIDRLSSSAAETIKSNSSTEGILPRSISVCTDIPFVGKVCLSPHM